MQINLSDETAALLLKYGIDAAIIGIRKRTNEENEEHYAKILKALEELEYSISRAFGYIK